MSQSQTQKAPKSGGKRLLRSISKFLAGGSSSSTPSSSSQLPPSSSAQQSAGQQGAGAGKGKAGKLNGARTPTRQAAGEPEQVPLREVTNASSASSSPVIQHHLHDDASSRFASSAQGGADEDASIRPITPHSFAASALTRTDSTSLDTHGGTTDGDSLGGAPTGKMSLGSYASTKPTTLLSVESTGGANRIAVAGPSHSNNHARTSSLGSASLTAPSVTAADDRLGGPAITFSALPPSTPPTSSSLLQSQQQTTPPSPDQARSQHRPESSKDGSGSILLPAALANNLNLNAPRHTLAHPRNNPPPSGIPADNASLLTLASSSFAPSISHVSRLAAASTSGGGGGIPPSGSRRSLGGAASIGGGTGWVADEDASVRALAPSRRASDESLASRSTWDTSRVFGAGAVGGDGGSLRSSMRPTGAAGESLAGKRSSGLTVGTFDGDGPGAPGEQDRDGQERGTTAAQEFASEQRAELESSSDEDEDGDEADRQEGEQSVLTESGRGVDGAATSNGEHVEQPSQDKGKGKEEFSAGAAGGEGSQLRAVNKWESVASLAETDNMSFVTSRSEMDD